MRQTPAMEMSDEELACRVRQGCVPSFEELVRRFQAPMLHFLRNQGAARCGRRAPGDVRAGFSEAALLSAAVAIRPLALHHGPPRVHQSSPPSPRVVR